MTSVGEDESKMIPPSSRLYTWSSSEVYQGRGTMTSVDGDESKVMRPSRRGGNRSP